MGDKDYTEHTAKNKIVKDDAELLRCLCDLQKLVRVAITDNNSVYNALRLLRNELQAESLHIIELKRKENDEYFGRGLCFCGESDSSDFYDEGAEWEKCDPIYISYLQENEVIKITIDDSKKLFAGEEKWFHLVNMENGIILPMFSSDNSLFGLMGIINPVSLDYNEDFLKNVALDFAGMFEHIRTLKVNEKQIEQLAEAKAEAEEASEVKSRFLANMSHEIRTPMNAVIGMAEIAMREDLPKRAEESILQIRASGEHLLSIINDILDFSKLESGKMEIIDDNYHMITLLNDVENIIQPRMRKKNLEFHVELDPKVPEVLLGDEKRIRQILLNFVNNSIKFTEEGSVTLRVRILERKTNEIMLRFEVEDTGSGIRSEDLQRLFNAFEQVDKLQHKNVEGTGLGLSISKLLVQLMNGSIGVESEYGKGSLFYIELSQKIINALPCGEYRYLAPIERKEEQVCFVAPDAKILLVDDTEMNLVVEKGLLGPYNMQLVVAHDGLEAIEKLKSGERYDLIFMDHMMPKLDGVKATVCIREMEDPYFKNVPIVALTANAIKSAQELFKAAGMNDFIAKPVEFKEITRVLLTWLPKNLIIPTSAEVFADDADWNEEIQKLSELLDITVVKKYFSGKMDVYMRALRKFIKDGSSRNEKIREAYKNSDWENYTIYVHSMKSSCATIGAFEISNMARELEIAAKAESIDYIDTHTEIALGYMESLLNALREMLFAGNEQCDEAEIEDFETISEQKLKDYLNELKEAIYTAKISNAEDIIEEMNIYGYNGKSLKEFTEKIKAMLDDFQLDEAIGSIDRFWLQN